MPPDQVFPDVGSFEAARLLISRLQAEVYGQEWDPDLLGVEFTLPEDVPFALTEAQDVITVGDLLLASLSLIFSLFDFASDSSELEPEELLGLLGLGVASGTPEGG